MNDIVSALLERVADKSGPAVYRTSEEQVIRLEAMFQKWVKKRQWTQAALDASVCLLCRFMKLTSIKTHKTQMVHAAKGCLTRPRNDIASDGSRIESLHKHLNNLQRSFSSGLVMFSGLSADFVCRRNIRITYAKDKANAFVSSTFRSHHLSLVNSVALRWNKLVPSAPKTIFPNIRSDEVFGIVTSEHAVGGGFIKNEEEEIGDLDDPTLPLPSNEVGNITDEIQDGLIEQLNINPNDFNKVLEDGK